MILIIFISLLTILPLAAPGYFPMHDDLQVMRIFEIERCFADGQIPCRWAPDMTFGFGQAMFNFYSALPYYLGVLIRLLAPVSILVTAKLLFAISLVAGSIGMYFLAKEFFRKSGAIAAAALYALAPYRAVNVYVRGALSESLSLSILPFLWLFIYKTIKNPSYINVSFLALAIAALLSTHNISTMIFFAPTAVWALFWLIQNFELRKLLGLVFASFLGFGLSGFFIIPVILETNLIKDEVFVSNYSYFAGHFVTLNQLFFSRFWGYGGSIFGPEDGLSFQVGWPHWQVAVFVGALALYRLYKKRDNKVFVVLGLLGVALIALFMSHNKSTFIWTSISTVSFVQFPWRFLGIALFLISFAAGGISFVKGKMLGRALALSIIFVAIALNLNYFRPEKQYDWLTDEIKLSGVDFEVQQMAAPFDYLPKTVEGPPLNIAPDLPEVVEGDADIPNLTKTSNSFFFDAFVRERAVVDVPIIYFPDWEVYLLEGQGVPVNVYPSEVEGLVRVELPEGSHMVYGRFVNTPIRSVANTVTIVSFLVLVGGFIVSSNKDMNQGSLRKLVS